MGMHGWLHDADVYRMSATLGMLTLCRCFLEVRVEHYATSCVHVQVNAYAGYGANQGSGYTDNQGAGGTQASGYGQSGYGQSQPSSGAMQVLPSLKSLDAPAACAISVDCSIVKFMESLQRLLCCL